MKLISKIIKEIDEFPTLPTIYTTLSDLMSNPRTTAKDIADVVAQDQSTASKVLKTANSPFYGLRGRVASVSQAVIYIGFEEIKNLVLAISVLDIFNQKINSPYLNPVDLWKHSIAVGVITRYIGRESGAENIEQYFVAGILHDIGKLIFLKSLPELYSRVLQYTQENSLSSRDVEKQIIGMSHTLAGKLLAERWRLPLSIIHSIANQYTGVVEGKVDHIVASVHVANIVASLLDLGKSGDEIVTQVNPVVWDHLKLHSNFFTRGLPVFMKEYQDSVNLLLVTK